VSDGVLEGTGERIVRAVVDRHAMSCARIRGPQCMPSTIRGAIIGGIMSSASVEPSGAASAERSADSRIIRLGLLPPAA
jgi:hypothetical protein